MPENRQDLTQDEKTKELIQKAIAGDEAAFGQVYELYFDKIYRFVFYRVSEKETAEDLVAETFIRIWDKRNSVREVGAFTSWVYQIARNLVIDHYRSRKTTVSIDDLENVLEYEDQIIEQVNLDFDQQKIFRQLKHLSDDQQLVIKLKFIDDLENYEIAKLLEKTEGAIRVIQHRAIQQLKNLLKDHED